LVIPCSDCELVLNICRQTNAGSASATALDIAQTFIGAEPLDRQRPLVMAGPIALTLAIAIDKQLANAMRI
jgi:hypothetical protein